MQYRLSCTCGQTIPVSRSQAGMTVHCPACNSAVIVPTIRNLAKLPLVETETSSAASARTPGKKTWNLPLGIFAAICFLVLCGTWLYGARIFAERQAQSAVVQELEQWGIEQELNYGDEMIAQYSQADLWDVWNTYRSDGLASKHPPDFVAVKKYYDDRKQTMYRMFGIGAIALLGMVVASLVGRRKS